ncbi:MAG TPA: hypothetical protein PLF30_03410 [Candidatus Moranbacteria bacterium]|jgi:hypothetical protein|nr:hypothetical protein [Candidatus Moranbacteria bacterium]HOF42416.1 hypothetical protein [Candidatus Moranbacteria bacterium]HPX94575.1 hypothetical protein [Candidatus Moranbacteria bacterium]
MKKEMFPDVAFWLSVVAVVLSAAVSLFELELWLAGTQWMLIAIILGIWALFLKK